MKGVRVNFFSGNLRSVLGKLGSSTFDKKSDPFYIILCPYQALRYSIFYSDKNCQAVIIFNNLGI